MLKAYAKTQERRQLSAIKNLLRFYWMLMDMCLLKFNIYQSTVAPNCFKNHTNLILFKKNVCLMSDLTFTLSDVTSFQPYNLPGL